MKRLLRDPQRGWIAGIAAGFADYYSVDVVLVRAIFVVALILTGLLPGVIAYLALWVLIPPRPVEVVAPPPAAPSGP